MTFLARTTSPAARVSLLAAAVSPARLALGRAGAGGVLLLRPTTLGQVLGVRREQAEPMGWAVQMLGAREVALGLGAYVSLRRGDERASRLWLLAGLVSDALDAVAVAGAVGRGRVHTAPGAAVVVVATAAAAAQAAALAER